MIKYAILFLLFLTRIPHTIAQVDANFNVKPTICVNQNINLKNLSDSAFSSLWDLCNEDLLSFPNSSTLLTIAEANVPTALTVIYDSSEWFGFLSSRQNNKIFRLNLVVAYLMCHLLLI